MPEVQEIWVHPIKSLKGISVQSWPIDEHGFKHDRKYCVAQPNTKKSTDAQLDTVTQREIPKFTLIETSIDEKQEKIHLRYPADNGEVWECELPLNFEPSDDLPTFTCHLWGAKPLAVDMGVKFPKVKEFLHKISGIDGITIVCPKVRREVTNSCPSSEELGRVATSSFQDYFPGNLICEKSLRDLDEKVQARTDGQVKLQARNFRPNLVISDTAKPWDEDDWKVITVGGNLFYVPCRNVRCRVTTVNLEKGDFEPSHEPYKTMQSFRRIDEGAKYLPCFGMNLLNASDGFNVEVGDKIDILSRGPHKYINI